MTYFTVSRGRGRIYNWGLLSSVPLIVREETLRNFLLKLFLLHEFLVWEGEMWGRGGGGVVPNASSVGCAVHQCFHPSRAVCKWGPEDSRGALKGTNLRWRMPICKHLYPLLSFVFWDKVKSAKICDFGSVSLLKFVPLSAPWERFSEACLKAHGGFASSLCLAAVVWRPPTLRKRALHGGCLPLQPEDPPSLSPNIPTFPYWGAWAQKLDHCAKIPFHTVVCSMVGEKCYHCNSGLMLASLLALSMSRPVWDFCMFLLRSSPLLLNRSRSVVLWEAPVTAPWFGHRKTLPDICICNPRRSWTTTILTHELLWSLSNRDRWRLQTATQNARSFASLHRMNVSTMKTYCQLDLQKSTRRVTQALFKITWSKRTLVDQIWIMAKTLATIL